MPRLARVFDIPLVMSPAVKPGQVVVVGDGSWAVIAYPTPHPVRTQVWDELHARLPWLRDGDDPYTRLLNGIGSRQEVAP